MEIVPIVFTDIKAMLTQKNKNDLNDLFRDEYGKILSTFTRLFGIEYLELAEKIIDEAYAKARSDSQSKGIPRNLKHWLWNLAKIRGSEILRRENKLYDCDLNMNRISGEDFKALIKLDDELLIDNQLRMLFVCCHPSIPREAQVTLTLKLLGGLNNQEIATVLFANEPTIARRLEEGRHKVEELKLDYGLPNKSEQCRRLKTVHSILNHIFKHGYDYYCGRSQDNVVLCHESIKLTTLLTKHKQTNRPETQALLSFMLFEASRLPGRLDEEGRLLDLLEQDRSLWDKKMINKGLYHLGISSDSNNVSEYHLRAGISACHSIADSYEKTNWRKILSLYENYLMLNDDPKVALERAMVFSTIYGAREGINEIKRIRRSKQLESNHRLYSTLGNLYLQLNNYKEALENYKSAMKHAITKDDESFYRERIEICQNRIRMAHRYRHQKSF
jgi:predicted RNA polymerase sigma factor